MKLQQILILLFVLVSCSLVFFRISAQKNQSYAQVVFTDDFSNNFEKWQDVRMTFDMWSIVDQQADVFINRGSTLAELIPKDEYWDPAWKNYIYKLDYTYLRGADKALSFWFQDILNWYQFHFVGNSYILSHIENGQEVWRVFGDLVLDAGRTYDMEVHLKDGMITFYVDGQQKFQLTDPTFNNDYGRIGLKAGAGAIAPTHVQFDNIVVTLLADTFTLPITAVKQTDPAWKDLEYDSASQWSPTQFGIGDWGCLLTSIDMILQYHAITNFPDGTEITPATLNTWLQNQTDGFIGPGLINWSAISRLVKQIHDTSGSVNLEYSRIPGSDLTSARLEIQNNKPVIVEIPGHFLVGNGIPESDSDIIITDPAYDYTLLSQHQTELLSTRLLTPSFTDLSYIHLSHQNTISVALTDNTNSAPATYQSYSQFLSNETTAQQSPAFTLHEFAKPETGIYNIQIHSTDQTPQPFTLTVFAYDINANLSNLSYTGVAGPTDSPTVVTLQFEKNGASSSAYSNTNYSHLESDLYFYLEQNVIQKKYVALELIQLTKAAQNASVENQLRYVSALRQTIDWYSEYIPEPTQTSLLERIAEIQRNL